MTTMTNLEHIRTMPEASLAKFLSNIANDDCCHSCPAYGKCDAIHEKRLEARGITDEDEFLPDHCKVVMRMWLRSPKGKLVVDEKLI